MHSSFTSETGVLSALVSCVRKTNTTPTCLPKQAVPDHNGSKAQIMTTRNSVDQHSALPTQTQQSSGCSELAPVGSWAVRSATSSTPMGNPLPGNRFSVLVSTDDEAGNSSDGFHLVQSRRSVRRNKRNLESPTDRNQTQSVVKSQLGTGKTRVFGKGVPCSITAASKLYRKAIFCVDNVSESCEADDILAHVTDMGVHVISCYKVASRRRRNESSNIMRRAFRLCIPVEDKDNLLNPANWPDSVTVSDWYFKKPDQDKRQKLDHGNTSANAITVRNTSPVAQSSSHDTTQHQAAAMDETNDDDDDTLVSTDHSQQIDTGTVC